VRTVNAQLLDQSTLEAMHADPIAGRPIFLAPLPNPV
jgi:hypothetical protein